MPTLHAYAFFLPLNLSALCIWSIVLSMVSFTEATVDCHKQADLYDDSSTEVCLVRIPVLKAGDAFVMELSIDKEPTFNLSSINSSEQVQLDFDIHIEQDWIVQGPDQVSVVTYGGKGEGKILLQGTGRVGKAVVFLRCTLEGNDTIHNTSCPLSDEMLTYLQREASFVHYLELNIVIDVIGWIYCIVWIIGFYPQIILNCQRRSVAGLNFDFLALNLTGGLAYAMFNIGLYWIPEVKDEYFKHHPTGVNPVLLNDVVFGINAAVAQIVIVFQCFVFKRENQRLSYSGIVFLIVLWLVMIVPIGVSIAGHLSWLDYLYIISYVKLAITPIKYIPQVFFNFKHKSTEGLSVGYVLLEFIGGTFSVLQMLLLAYNFNDWRSIFGDPTKFGLGMISILFDMVLLFQHWVLYRGAKMRHHTLEIKCSCSFEAHGMQCRCNMERKRRLSSVVALPDHDVFMKSHKAFDDV